MKKSVLLTTILSCLICYLSVVYSQEVKDVFWIHGMGGNANSLKTLDQDALSNYRVITFRPGYSTSYGVYGSSDYLYRQLGSSRASNKNIFIAHSMGGVNSRALLDNHPGYFGGLITLATPHAGAPIANNIDNGVLDDILNNGLNKGLKGPKNAKNILIANITSATIISIVSRFFGRNFNNLYDLGEALIKDAVVKHAEKTVQETATKNALKTNSNEINRLKRINLSIPTIAIWGNEEYPTFLRLASSRELKNDNSLVKVVNAITDYCEAKMNYHKIRKYTGIVRYVWHKNLESDWRESKNYWGGELQKETDKLIGAIATEYRTVYYTDYECPVPTRDDFRVKPHLDPYTEPQMLPECRPVTKSRRVAYNVTYENDGLLPKPTQQAMPGCDVFLEAKKCNHDEMKYHQNVRDIMHQIFKGQETAPENRSFFVLDEK